MIEIPMSTAVLTLVLGPIIGFLAGLLVCVWFGEESK